MPHELPTIVAVSPSRLRRMGSDIMRLATYLEDLDARELPYRVDGGLVMDTSSHVGGTVTFSIRGTVDIHVDKAAQEKAGG